VNSNAVQSDAFALSVSQREIWLDQRAWPGSTHLLIGGVAYLDGALDVGLLMAALKLLVAESDALRLVPHENGTQTLLYEIRLPFEVIDTPEAPDLHKAAQSWWQRQLQDAYVWDGTPPWRFGLIRGASARHALVMQYHHLVMDGWGTARLIRRWSEIYNALHRGRAPAPTTAASYCRFVEDSNRYITSVARTRDGAYWAGQLPTLPPVLIDKRHVSDNDAPVGLVDAVVGNLYLPLAHYAKVKAGAAACGSTVFNVFLAAMAVYFARVANCQSVVIGVPNLNRMGKTYHDTLGMFVGVLPVQVTLTPGMTVAALLDSIAKTMRSALRHTRYPISELGHVLGATRYGRGGVFDVLLSFERLDYDVAFGDARMSESRQLFNGKARYPLGVTVCEFQSNQDPELVLEGSSACFAASEVVPIGERIWSLVLRMGASPNAVLDTLALVSEAQQAQVLAQHQGTVWHDQCTPYIAQFMARSHQTPDAVALVWDGGSMGYAQLRRCAHALARRLRALGAGPNTVVALAMPRSPELVVAILAVSAAGAAFLPLEPDAPTARLSDIVKESGALALVIQSDGFDRLASLHATVVVASRQDVPEDGAQGSDDFAPVTVAPESLAYVLFTSGSTGRPKGVMVEHAALAHRLAWLTGVYGITPADRSALSTQITFDPSLIELCLPLINGASVALPPAGRVLPETLAAFVIRQEATFIATVPSTLARFLNRVAGDPNLKLRVACCGGDVLPAELANRYLSLTKARLFNAYGPTEACIFATAWECVPVPQSQSVPIGRPVDNTCVYVLDSKLLPVPTGMHGDIFIGGAALARGYLGRPELDEQVFLPDPFRRGARMCRTGDTGWLDHDGNLHFVGRQDRQVKLRGYRIELGEIEAALLQVDGVTQTAVKVVQRTGKPVLHAWVSTAATLGADDLQKALRTRLPDYMIPSGISVVPELPVNDTGKVDYGMLHLPTDTVVVPTARAPKNEMERTLLTLWEKVLHGRPLGVQDNFFEAGGDSLDAVTILADLEKMVASPVPLFLLTENPTIEMLAQAMQKPIKAHPSILRFHADSTKPPFYIAVSGYGDLMRFQTLAHALKDTCDVRLLQPPLGVPVTHMEQLAHFYADLIVLQADVPGFVAGFSVGGIAALETARELQKRKVPLRGLILLDTLYPRCLWGAAAVWRAFVWLVRNYRLGDMTLNGRRLGAVITDVALVGQIAAMAHYRARSFEGPTILVKTRGLAYWDRLFFSPWRRLQQGWLKECVTDGLHGSIFEAEQVSQLARVLEDVIASG